MFSVDSIEKFEAFVSEVMAAEKAVGIAVAMVDRNGNTPYEKYFGFRDMERKLPVDADTMFGLASVSKSFTALSIMKLADEGKLSLNDPVNMYIPEIEDSSILVSHMLTHSAGYLPQPRMLVRDFAPKAGYSLDGAEDLAYSEGLSEAGTHMLAENLNEQCEFTGRPGELFSYSNDCYEILGDIVRRVSGERSFADYLDKFVLAPLKMTRTTAGYHAMTDFEGVSELYVREKGVPKGGHTYYDEATVLIGAGGMKASPNDMKKYMAMYLNDGKIDGGRMISAYGAREMQKPHQVVRLDTLYGYGLSIKPQPGFNVITHGGSMVGISSDMSWSREHGLGLIVLSNTSGVSVDAIARKARELLWDGMLTSFTWDSAKLDAACGSYASDEDANVEIYREGDTLFAKLDGGAPMRLYIANEYMLKVKQKFGETSITLHFDEDGGVDKLSAGFRVIKKVK